MGSAQPRGGGNLSGCMIQSSHRVWSRCFVANGSDKFGDSWRTKHAGLIESCTQGVGGPTETPLGLRPRLRTPTPQFRTLVVEKYLAA